jgi:predicted GH43/DUF377 family glycosyl hydrolase
MSMIRKLPGRIGPIMEKSKFPPNNLFYNPSVDQDNEYVCLRNTEATPNFEMNHMVLYRMATEELIKIAIPNGMLLPTYNAYRGIEDARIVKFKGRVWFTATSTHATTDMRNTVLLGYLNAKVTEVEYMTVLTNFPPPTKNICPFVHNSELYLLDAYERKIYKVDKNEDNTYVATFWKQLQTFQTEHYRGSTSPVHLHGNLWGYVVHDVIFNDGAVITGSKLSYMHRWIEFDIERGAITFESSPFWMLHWGIEFASGLRYNPKKQEVFLYFGVKDEVPCLCTTPLYELRVGKM